MTINIFVNSRKNTSRLLSSIVMYSFLLITLQAIFEMFYIDLKLGVILLFSSLLLPICKRNYIPIYKVDLLIIVYIVFVFLTRLLNNYDFKYFYYALVTELLPIAYFYIARLPDFSDRKFFSIMTVCIVAACVCGIYLYFIGPDWYATYRYSNIYSDSMDYYRMSSFWLNSYTISYMSCCTNMYIANRFIEGEKKCLNTFCYFITLISIFICQSRVTILFGIITFLYLNVGIVLKRKSVLLSYLIKMDFFVLLFAFFIFDNANVFLDDNTLNYVTDKFDSIVNSNQLVNDRISIFDKWLHKPFPFCGDGIGRYSHALESTNNMISDCEYLKIIFEKGILGFSLFLMIIIMSIYKGMEKMRIVRFELMVIAFYLVAMIGADPLSISDSRPWLFWLCLGRIYNKNIFAYEKNCNNNSKL